MRYLGGNHTTENQKSVLAENRMKCICEPCPSYNECMRGDEGLLFCINGKTQHCTFGMKGCSCPVCSVRKDRGYTKAYYCLRGSEREQS